MVEFVDPTCRISSPDGNCFRKYSLIEEARPGGFRDDSRLEVQLGNDINQSAFTLRADQTSGFRGQVRDNVIHISPHPVYSVQVPYMAPSFQQPGTPLCGPSGPRERSSSVLRSVSFGYTYTLLCFFLHSLVLYALHTTGRTHHSLVPPQKSSLFPPNVARPKLLQLTICSSGLDRCEVSFAFFPSSRPIV